MGQMLNPKHTVLVLSSLCLIAIAYPFHVTSAVEQSMEVPQNTGKTGVTDLPSSWHLRSGSGWTPANLTSDESVALKALCRLAVGANGGVWQSERLNAAISVLAFGADPPDNLQATVYKTCLMAGNIDRRRR
jgi:hypothetical protein